MLCWVKRGFVAILSCCVGLSVGLLRYYRVVLGYAIISCDVIVLCWVVRYFIAI